MIRVTLRNMLGWFLLWVLGCALGSPGWRPAWAQGAADACLPAAEQAPPARPVSGGPPLKLARCDAELTPAAFKPFGPDAGHKLQAGLAQVYHGKTPYTREAREPGRPLTDGVIGPVTITWVRTFCRDFAFAASPQLPQEILTALTHFAALQQVPADWQTTLLSANMRHWLEAQPETQRRANYAKRRSGQAQPINELLRDFATPQASPPSLADHTFVVKFTLTQGDIKALDTSDVVAALAKPVDEAQTKKQLEETLKTALKDDPQRASQYIPWIVAKAKNPPTYALTEAAMQQVASKEPAIPAALLKALDKLKGLSYPSRTALQEAVQAQLLALLEQYRAAIMVQAQQGTDYTLTREVLEQLKRIGVPSHIVDDLTALQDTTYATKAALQAAVQARIAKLLAHYKALMAQAFQEKTTYALTAQTFVNVKDQQIPAPLLEKLLPLTNKPYATREDIATITALLIQGVTEQYVPRLVDAATWRIVFYQLTDKVLATLKEAQFPPAVLASLQPLHEEVYWSKKRFQTEVTRLLEPLLGQYSLYPSALAKAAEPHTVYRLTEQALSMLPSKGVPPDLVGQLLSLQDSEYSSEEQLEKALDTALGSVLAPANQYPIWAAEAADEKAHYGLMPQALKDLATQGLPEDWLTPLLSLPEKDYLSKQPFAQAVDAALRPVIRRYEQYPALIAAEAEVSETYAVTEPLRQELQRTLLLPQPAAPTTAPGAPLPPGQLTDKLRALQDIDYASERLFAQALATTLAGYTLAPAQTQQIIAAAKKVCRIADFAPKPVAWSADDCGCGLVDDTINTVYGFYPFWLAGPGAAAEGGKPPAPGKDAVQKIDFSAFSRIGYYARSFDQTGALTAAALPWQPERAAFINEARKYKTKVDLVLMQDWAQFAEAVKNPTFIETLTTNIVKDIRQHLGHFWFNRLRPLLSFGFGSVPVLGDGVTLYFHGEPEATSRVHFGTFMRTLRAKLCAQHAGHYLNLLLSPATLAPGQVVADYLATVIPSHDEVGTACMDEPVNLVLVFLESPTTETKKALRATIEHAFHGLQRRNLLRKIVPVLPPVGHERDEFRQLRDDLIYFQDNFHGVGFWPLPLAQMRGAREVLGLVKERLIEVKSQSQPDPIEHLLFTYAPAICEFACPHRWLIRLLWDIPLLLLVLYGLVAIWNCTWRHWAQQHFWLFLGLSLLTLLLFYISSACDPFWQHGTMYVSIVFVLAGIGVPTVQAIKRMRQAGAP